MCATAVHVANSFWWFSTCLFMHTPWIIRVQVQYDVCLCGVSVLMLQQIILSTAVYTSSLVQSLSLYNIVDDLIICAIVSYYVRYSMVPRQPFASLDHCTFYRWDRRVGNVITDKRSLFCFNHFNDALVCNESSVSVCCVHEFMMLYCALRNFNSIYTYREALN